MMRRVSLYIPCYNAKEYIAQCLEGIFKQTYPIDEVLVIDDGPGDETAKIVSRYTVKLIQRREKLGLPSARNTAFRLTQNNFVATLDVDCTPEPHWLERLMENFTEEDIVGVGGRCIEKYTYTLADKWRAVYMRQNWGDEKIINPPCLFGNNNIFKKSAIIEVGFFDEERYSISYEDVDISQRLKKIGYKLIYEPEARVYHLRRDNLSSLLKTHGNWYFTGVGGKRTPDNLFNLCCKIYDSFFYSLDYIKEDICKGRPYFLHIDILIFFHHLFCDLKYYILSKIKRHLFV